MPDTLRSLSNGNSNNIRSVFSFVVAGLALLGFLTLFGLYVSQTNHIDNKVWNTSIIINAHIKHKIHDKAQLYLGLIELIQNDQELISALTNNNRDAFQKKAHNIYQRLHNNFKTTHFYVHDTNKINFIRVHFPTRHSDAIDRYTLNRTAQSQKTVYGVEFGWHNNLTLRVVTPWIVNGKLIGYLELGEEIGHMFSSLLDELNVQFILSINKELINETMLQTWLNDVIDHKRPLIKTDHYVILYNSEDHINPKILSHIDSLDTRGKDYHFNDTSIAFSSMPFMDVSNQQIGKLTIVSNVEQELDYMYELMAGISIIGVLVSLIMLSFLYNYLKKMQSQIDDGYARINVLAIRDGLTGLFNRRYFDEMALDLKNQAEQLDTYISFTMLDIDQFKQYNDTYGHSKGDDVIRAVANAINDTYPTATTDCLFRIGGEEFAIIILNQNKEQVLAMAEQLRQAVQTLAIPHSKNGSNRVVTISIGIAFQRQFKNIDQLYQLGDQALYRAKEKGRNRIEVSQQS